MTLNHHLIGPSEIESIEKALTAALAGTMVGVITNDSLITKESQSTVFSQTELKKASSYINEKRRTEYLIGRYAIKMLLGRRLPQGTPLQLITVDNNSDGAPFVRLDTSDTNHPILSSYFATLLTPPIVSITHKAQIIIAVIAPEATVQGIGVDLEYRTPQKTTERARDRMVELIGSQKESSLVESVLSDVRRYQTGITDSVIDTDPFLALFSIKEAVYKVLRGKANTLKKIDLLSFSQSKNPEDPFHSFRSQLRYQEQTVEAITLETEFFLVSLAWI